MQAKLGSGVGPGKGWWLHVGNNQPISDNQLWNDQNVWTNFLPTWNKNNTGSSLVFGNIMVIFVGLYWIRGNLLGGFETYFIFPKYFVSEGSKPPDDQLTTVFAGIFVRNPSIYVQSCTLTTGYRFAMGSAVTGSCLLSELFAIWAAYEQFLLY